MPEHFHLMLSPSPANGVVGESVAHILHNLKTPLSQRVLNEWSKTGNVWLKRVTNHDNSKTFWQPGGGFDRNPRDLDELQREVRYIHHNPVTRRLVANPIDWPWSSARWWAGLPDDRVRIHTASQSRDWAL
jgi:putative transposase